MSDNKSDAIKKTDYLHFGADGNLKGVTGVNNKGEFTLYKDLASKDQLIIGKNDLYYTGDRICIGDVCLDKDSLERISSFFNLKVNKRVSENFYKEYEELLKKELKTVDDIFVIVLKLIEFYSKLSLDEKKIFIDDVFINKLRLPKLGIVIDQSEKSFDLMNIVKKTDINISRMEYKIDSIKLLNIDTEIPFYELSLSGNDIPTKLIVLFDNMVVKFAILDNYSIQDLEYKYYSIYREKNILAINQIDNVSIYELRPHDLKILIDNMKSLTLVDGIYRDIEYVKSLCVNNINIDVYKLDALLYFPNDFKLKEFDFGEYESLREDIDGYLVGTLI